MSKWDRVRGSMARAHNDLFDSRYEVTFYNYSAGDYNPDTGQLENETKSSIGSATVEIVPPAQDSTIDLQGTDIDFTTSFRVPIADLGESAWGTNWGTNWGGKPFYPLGEDNNRPTEIEITEQTMGETQTFELQSYSTEYGSGMVMLRVVD